jgi:hypothetical protein
LAAVWHDGRMTTEAEFWDAVLDVADAGVNRHHTLYDEHGELVDKSFVEGLSEQESSRLSDIRRELESIEAVDDG